MNKQQTEWLEYYIDSGDAVKAVEAVYVDVSEQNRASKASHLKQTLVNEIDQHGREQYKREVPLMLNVIKTIALDCDQPAVKLKAASEWLSRAGHDAIQVIEVKQNATHEELLERFKIAATGMSKEQLKGLLPDNLINLIGEDNETQTKH